MKIKLKKEAKEFIKDYGLLAIIPLLFFIPFCESKDINEIFEVKD